MWTHALVGLGAAVVGAVAGTVIGYAVGRSVGRVEGETGLDSENTSDWFRMRDKVVQDFADRWEVPA